MTLVNRQYIFVQRCVQFVKHIDIYIIVSFISSCKHTVVNDFLSLFLNFFLFLFNSKSYST